MRQQLTLFDIDEEKPIPRCGNCAFYSWVKYYGGRYQECSVRINKAGRPLRPKASQKVCYLYDRK